MTQPTATVHIRIPAAQKGRWIRASRAAGLRLGDLITQAVEAHMQQQAIKITIPEGLTFADLHLARAASGDVSFDWAAVERICEASGLAVAAFRDAPDDHVAQLLVGWYDAHRQQGGAIDPVAEDLMHEVRAEDAAGMATSLPPGRA